MIGCGFVVNGQAGEEDIGRPADEFALIGSPFGNLTLGERGEDEEVAAGAVADIP